jgi:hypothetical protein
MSTESLALSGVERVETSLTILSTHPKFHNKLRFDSRISHSPVLSAFSETARGFSTPLEMTRSSMGEKKR